MQPKDVKFTEKMIEFLDYIIYPGQGKRIKVDWDNEDWKKVLLQYKERFLENFIELMHNCLYNNFYDYIRSEFKIVDELIVDKYMTVGIFEYYKKIDPKNLDQFRINAKDNLDNYTIIRALGASYHNDNKFFAECYNIDSTTFSLDDIDFNVFNVYNSLEFDAYFKSLVKARPIMDKLDKEEREIFKGIF